MLRNWCKTWKKQHLHWRKIDINIWVQTIEIIIYQDHLTVKIVIKRYNKVVNLDRDRNRDKNQYKD